VKGFDPAAYLTGKRLRRAARNARVKIRRAAAASRRAVSSKSMT
jgi:hypothetical protein